MKNLGKEFFYHAKFKEAIFVLKIGGKLLTDSQALTRLLLNVQQIVYHDIRVILVHGGGIQTDDLSQRLGHTPQKINGRRITTAEDLEIAKMAVAGVAHIDLLGVLKKCGLKALSFSAIANDLLEVELRPKQPVDFGYVGDIKSVNPRPIEEIIHSGYILVIPSLSATADGTIVNINADTIATQIAIATRAHKLIFFLDVDGVLYDEKVISVLSERDIERLLDNSQVFAGMKVKLENCRTAITNGVKRVHLLNGFSEDMLVNEIFTPTGSGTMVVSEREKQDYLNEMEYL